MEDILFRKNTGHYYLRIPAFYSKENNANDRIPFIIDTGAYLTVLNRHTATLFGFDKLIPIRSNLTLRGFGGGECLANLVELPGIIIGGKILEGVRVAIPQNTEGTNILGLNVLEYFNYVIDSTNSKMYFSQNDNYKIPSDLKCTNIRTIK